MQRVVMSAGVCRLRCRRRSSRGSRGRGGSIVIYWLFSHGGGGG